MSQTFLEANPENLFVAYRFKQPPHVNAGAPKAKGKKRKATSGDDSGADGVAVASGAGLQPGDKFESKGTVWQLFRIYETVTEAGCNSIACAYFDVDAAESFGQECKYFLNLPVEHQESNFRDLDLDHLEVAFHDEVVKWIQESDLPTPASHVEKSAGRRTSSRVIPATAPRPVIPPKPKAKRVKRKAAEGLQHTPASTNPTPPLPPRHLAGL